MFKNLRKNQPSVKVHEPIVDLDAIVSEPTPFRFGGKIHFIKPISFKEFLKFTSAQSQFMQKLQSDEQITPLELATRYHEVTSSVCDTITVSDIQSMEQAQVAALYQLIIDVVAGQVKTGDSAEDAKKKRFRLPIYELNQAALSQSAPETSDGPTIKS